MPERLARLVEKCLQKRRDLRPATMDEVRDELRAILRADDAPAPKRSVIPLVVAALAVLGVAAGGAVWKLSGSDPKPPPPCSTAAPRCTCSGWTCAARCRWAMPPWRGLLTGAPVAAYVCHCNYCQKSSGTAFQMPVFFKHRQVEFSGEPSIQPRMSGGSATRESL